MIRGSNKVKDADIFLSKFVLVTRILVSHYSLNRHTQFFEMVVVDSEIRGLFWF